MLGVLAQDAFGASFRGIKLQVGWAGLRPGLVPGRTLRNPGLVRLPALAWHESELRLPGSDSAAGRVIAMHNTHGKVAVVTGGSAGIGEAACRALAGDGWTVYVAARRIERCEQIAQEIGGVAVGLDVRDEGSVKKLQALAQVDLLVNNAGGAKQLDYLRDANAEDWQWMFDTNVMGTMRVTKALYPQLKAAKGLVINIGSIAGTDAYPGGSGYNAAKYGLRGMTRAMRREEAPDIRICEIDPGRVKTDFSLNRFDGDTQRAAAVYEGKLNLTAEDVAEAIRWVASLPPHVNIDALSIMPADQAER